jgi:ribosomal protein L7/L12
MPPPLARSAGHDRPRRLAWTPWAGCLAYLLFLAGLLEVPDVLGRVLGQPYVGVFYLIVAAVFALVKVRQVHRRGQTVAEAVAASVAARRDQAEQRRRRRAGRRDRARHEAALPWLTDKELRPGALPGVVITPAAVAVTHPLGGYDVVLDCPGDRRIQVIVKLRQLTWLSLKEAKGLVDTAPVPLIRVPDMPMAQAVKYVLESAGATASITEPGATDELATSVNHVRGPGEASQPTAGWPSQWMNQERVRSRTSIWWARPVKAWFSRG